MIEVQLDKIHSFCHCSSLVLFLIFTEYLTKIISQVPAWPKVAFSKFPEAQSMHCLDPPLEIKFPLPWIKALCTLQIRNHRITSIKHSALTHVKSGCSLLVIYSERVYRMAAQLRGNIHLPNLQRTFNSLVISHYLRTFSERQRYKGRKDQEILFHALIQIFLYPVIMTANNRGLILRQTLF